MNEREFVFAVNLIRKYNQPVPRYTSYRTVPYWQEEININEWIDNAHKQFSIHNSTKGIRLYIHLPFYESLYTYCSCNKK